MQSQFGPARREVPHSPWRRRPNPPPESTIRVLLPGRRYASPSPGGACSCSGPVDKPDNTRCPTPVVAGQHQLSRVGRAAVTQIPRQASTTTSLSSDSPRPPPSPLTHFHAPHDPRIPGMIGAPNPGHYVRVFPCPARTGPQPRPSRPEAVTTAQPAFACSAEVNQDTGAAAFSRLPPCAQQRPNQGMIRRAGSGPARLPLRLPLQLKVKAGVPNSSGVGRRGFDPRQLQRTKRTFFPPLAI